MPSVEEQQLSLSGDPTRLISQSPFEERFGLQSINRPTSHGISHYPTSSHNQSGRLFQRSYKEHNGFTPMAPCAPHDPFGPSYRPMPGFAYPEIMSFGQQHGFPYRVHGPLFEQYNGLALVGEHIPQFPFNGSLKATDLAPVSEYTPHHQPDLSFEQQHGFRNISKILTHDHIVSCPIPDVGGPGRVESSEETMGKNPSASAQSNPPDHQRGVQ